jgi:ABC-type thiamin/hydroxymethylpyrimidine transport system permease subunit
MSIPAGCVQFLCWLKGLLIYPQNIMFGISTIAFPFYQGKASEVVFVKTNPRSMGKFACLQFAVVLNRIV